MLRFWAKVGSKYIQSPQSIISLVLALLREKDKWQQAKKWLRRRRRQPRRRQGWSTNWRENGRFGATTNPNPSKALLGEPLFARSTPSTPLKSSGGIEFLFLLLFLLPNIHFFRWRESKHAISNLIMGINDWCHWFSFKKKLLILWILGEKLFMGLNLFLFLFCLTWGFMVFCFLIVIIIIWRMRCW